MLNLINKYLKGPARFFAVLAPLTMLVEVFMDLQQPTLMSDIIDVGVANGDMAYILRIGLKMVAFAVIGFIGGASCSLFACKAGVSMSGELRQALFEKIQSLSFSEIDHFKTSSLITRMTNDVIQVQNMLLMMLRIMVRSPLLCLGGIVMSYLLSPQLSLIFCVILPILIVSIYFVLLKSIPVFTQVQIRLDRVNTVMRENLLGIRVVKSLALEPKQFERFTGVNDALTEKSIQAQNMTFLLMPVVTLLMNASTVFILWAGGNMVILHNFEVGKIMAFVNYMVQITNSLMMTIGLVINISRAQASAERIDEVFATQPTIREDPRPQAPGNYDIEFRNVSFRYGQSGEPVLKNLSFTVRQGETLGIIGATGSGKSSLVNLIPRLYDVNTGQVLLGNVDIRKVGLEELRRNIGIVMQESILFWGTIQSNLCYGDENASENDLIRASADAQALDFIQALPQAFESPVEQRGRNFSGGQKQRLSIARTLLKKPKILILDDASSALDLKTESKLRAALIARARGSTLIVIAQRISAVMEADQILVLDHGEISAVGNHSELLQTSEIYRSIAVSQLGEEVVTYGSR
ncbi:ABC-type multidrug transport system, ATPase and permease component [Longilinea arvoryzae]|uniref:ABC-type multidrug transport system, ATPase and permease component n=1 Tax=Longilinea arvoryzae TaxID=360412 RepID=A0A0S7BCV2_9CHLR|nr:ABC transporter ATP-binding protein [Longilinea arvoryzae]GAP15708.1 ABC-type multidrug transport system, ATPase and permease component [Longilinea arvoryzae]